MDWWEVLVQQSINGLTRGSVFALVAMGYTMVYGIIELINFAHGDVFMLGLVISLSYFALLGMARTLHGWELVTVLPLVFRLAPLITAIGVSFMLENIALVWKGPAPFSYPDIFPSVDILYDWLGWDSKIFLTTKDLLVFGATIPLMLALQYFVTRTNWGKAMRATAQDRETAQAMGINVGYQAGLRAFTAAVLGGIGNMPGAALGGLVIGFLSAWSDQYISARWTNAVVFTILILVLVFRPHGLLGERTVDKV